MVIDRQTNEGGEMTSLVASSVCSPQSVFRRAYRLLHPGNYGGEWTKEDFEALKHYVRVLDMLVGLLFRSYECPRLSTGGIVRTKMEQNRNVDGAFAELLS